MGLVFVCHLLEVVPPSCVTRGDPCGTRSALISKDTQTFSCVTLILESLEASLVLRVDTAHYVSRQLSMDKPLGQRTVHGQLIGRALHGLPLETSFSSQTYEHLVATVHRDTLVYRLIHPYSNGPFLDLSIGR